MADKKLVAILTLDNKNFKSNLSESEKSILKFSGSVSAAGAAILAATKYAANFQDDTVKMARAAGVASESFSAYAYAAELSGVSNEQLVKSFTKLNNITPATADNLEKFGVSVYDASGNLKASETIMGDLADRMQGMKNPADQAALAVAAFGEKGTSMVNMLVGGREALAEAAQEAENFGLIVSEKAGANAEKFNDDISRVGLSVKGLTSTIAESIIEFTNQSGIVSAISSGISELTKFWKGLDDDVKSFIVTLGSGVVVTSAVVAGIIGLKVALGVVLAAIGPVTLAVAAVVGAISVLTAEGIKYSDSIKNIIAPAVDILKKTFDPFIKLFSDIASGIMGLIKPSEDADNKISAMGTTVEFVVKIISTLGVIASSVFQGLSNLLINLLGMVGNVAQQIWNFFTGDFKGAVSAGEAAFENLKQSIVGTVTISGDAKKAISDIWATKFKINIDSSDVNKAGTGVADLGEEIKKTSKYKPIVSDLETQWKNVGDSVAYAKENTSQYSQVVATLGQAVSATAGILGQFAGQISKISGFIAKSIMRDADKAINLIDKQLIDLQDNYNAQVEAFKAAETEKIKNLESAYDKQIQEIKNQEAMKSGIIEAAAAERLLLADKEYQAAKEKKELEYQEYVARETAKFEQEKALLLANTADKEQAQLVETMLNEQFNQKLQNMQSTHDADMVNFATEYTSTQTEISDQLKTDLTENSQSASDAISTIEDNKSTAVTDANQAMSNTLVTMQDEYNAEQKRLENDKLKTQYNAEKEAYETTKAAKIAEIIVAGLAAAFNVVASMAPLGPAGLVIGGILAAAIGVSTGLAVADIEASSPPPPPQLLEDGGFIGGNTSHAQGGFAAEIESDEFVINKTKTQKIENFLDSGMSQGQSVIINFNENSISGMEIDNEKTAIKIGQLIGDQLRRQGVVA